MGTTEKRVAALLALAKKHKISLKNLPNAPSDSWLDRAEAKLRAAVKKRSGARAAKRAELVALAKEHRLNLRNVPDDPSDAWLNKARKKVDATIAAKLAKKAADAEAAQAAQAVPAEPERPDEEEESRTERPVPKRASRPPRRPKKKDAPPLPPPDLTDAATPVVQERILGPDREPVDHNAKLVALLARASTLRAKVRKVPAQPSKRWLDKLESTLDEVQRRRASAAQARPLPADPTATFGPTDRVEQRADADPDTTEIAQPALDSQEAKARVAELQEMAERAGVRLGRIPPNPTKVWITKTTAALDRALKDKRKQNSEERKRLAAQRERRIERLKAAAEENHVDLAPFPLFPTEDWLGRAELKVHQASTSAADEEPSASAAHRKANIERRLERIRMVRARAEVGGFDLGEIPPDPTDTWLDLAEARADEREEEAADLIEAIEDEGPSLVYEGGTLQEEIYPMEEDVITVGRGRSSHVQIRNDGQVSRLHCTITRTGTGFWVEDAGSTRGTRVDGALIDSPTPLFGGEMITVGATSLAFQTGQ